jgi:deoxyguanosine kinase
VIGPIGSGKTTVSRLLSDKLKLPLLDADLYEENPFLPNYITDNSRWAFATELFFTLKRLKKLQHLKPLLKTSSVIVDSGLIMSQLYTKNHLVTGTMTSAEWNFYQEILEDYQTNLPQPNLVIALLAKPTSQLKRIKARGRSFEAGYTLEYLKQITDRLHEYLRSLESHPTCQLLTIDTDRENLTLPSAQTKLITKLTTLL